LIHFIQLLKALKEIDYFKVKGVQFLISHHERDISVIELDKLYKCKQRKFVRSGRGSL